MLTTKATYYYSDWDNMIENTQKDIEFLDRLEVVFEYKVLIGKDNKIEVEFITFS